jgi:hypothetical protein
LLRTAVPLPVDAWVDDARVDLGNARPLVQICAPCHGREKATIPVASATGLSVNASCRVPTLELRPFDTGAAPSDAALVPSLQRPGSLSGNAIR